MIYDILESQASHEDLKTVIAKPLSKSEI